MDRSDEIKQAIHETFARLGVDNFVVAFQLDDVKMHVWKMSGGVWFDAHKTVALVRNEIGSLPEEARDAGWPQVF